MQPKKSYFSIYLKADIDIFKYIMYRRFSGVYSDEEIEKMLLAYINQVKNFISGFKSLNLLQCVRSV